jgi:hypothetical protein
MRQTQRKRGPLSGNKGPFSNKTRGTTQLHGDVEGRKQRHQPTT